MAGGRTTALVLRQSSRAQLCASRPSPGQADRSQNLVSFFGYGLANWTEFEQGGILWDRPHYYAPAELADRIDHVVLGTLNATGWKPDLVWFSSGMWDSACARRIRID